MKRFNAVLTVLFILNVLTFAQWGGSQTRTTTKPSSTPMAYKPANTPRPVSTPYYSKPNPTPYFAPKLNSSGGSQVKAAPTPKINKWGGTSSSTQPLPTISETDRQAILRAKQQGKAFKTREDALNDFKQKNKDKYNNYYTVQPKQRPAEIPEVMVINNVRRPTVYYNNQYGAYDNNHVFVPYSHWNDEAFIAAELARQNYVYSQHVDYVDSQPVNFSFGWFGKTIILIFVVSALIFALLLVRKVLAS